MPIYVIRLIDFRKLFHVNDVQIGQTILISHRHIKLLHRRRHHIKINLSLIKVGEILG